MRILSVLILLFLTSCLFAEEKNKKLEAYISKNKKEQFKYDYKKVEAQSLKLRDSWISPLHLNFSYSKSNPYKNEQTMQSTSINLDQAIFQSGGIYYGIKFAEASKIYSNYAIDMQKRKLVKDAISLLMQIKQMDLKIEKQKLKIKNAEINLEQKKEQYLSGQLDSGFLDNAIIERNIVIQILYDIETNKERLVSKFHAISDIDYKTASIPHLKILKKDEFLKHNIVMKISKSDIEKNRYSKDVTLSKYLPRISVVAGYNWDKTEDQQFGNTGAGFSGHTDYYNYGLRASMPLDINTFRDIEVSKVEYLKSKVAIKDKKRELLAIYEQVMQNIANFDKKKSLSLENKELYEKLLSDTKDLFEAGYKTEYDVSLLKNSVEIQKIDLKIFEIDKQLELLTLYEMYKNEI